MTTYKLPATPAASDIKAAYRQIRADTCVTCPTKDLGVLISSIAYKPVIDTFMYRFAGPLGNATMGSEVDAVWGVNATQNGAFAFNVDLSNTMQDYWCACSTNIKCYLFSQAWVFIKPPTLVCEPSRCIAQVRVRQRGWCAGGIHRHRQGFVADLREYDHERVRVFCIPPHF